MDDDKITKIAGVSADRRRMLVRYYATMPEADRLEAHRLTGDLIRQHRNEKPDEYYFYGLLIMALGKMYWTRYEALTRKNSLTDTQAEDIAEKRLQTFKAIAADKRHKRKKKAQLISIRFYQLIKKLRGEGLSWRGCADYIERYHKKKFSHQYLKTTMEKLEGEGKNAMD